MSELKITISADGEFLKALNALSDSILAASAVLEVRTNKTVEKVNAAPSTPAVNTPVQSVNTAPAPTQPTTVQPVYTAPIQQPPINTTPVQPTVSTQAPVQPAPVQQPTGYTLEQLSNAAVTLLNAGKQQELINLLKSFGVNALPQLPKEKYNDFAVAIRGMGAQI
jgi:uncharacterized protein YkwD